MANTTPRRVKGGRDRYLEVAERVAREGRPVMWGKYSTSNNAYSRRPTLERSPHNKDVNLKFASRNLSDGAYIFAYLLPEHEELLNPVMTYDELRTVRDWPVDEVPEATYTKAGEPRTGDDDGNAPETVGV